MDPAVRLWRVQQRARLLAVRRAIPVEDRQRAVQIIADKLDTLVESNGHETVGVYWPIRHEINLLPWSDALAKRGKIALCLPVVVTPNAPLEYWRWQHGETLSRGIWDIPIPANRDVVIPDLMLAPLLGFDQANYRLGNGGGYFDRTLASLARRPMVVGIGYECCALNTIFPQPHDIPMDMVLTEQRGA